MLHSCFYYGHWLGILKESLIMNDRVKRVQGDETIQDWIKVNSDASFSFSLSNHKHKECGLFLKVKEPPHILQTCQRVIYFVSFEVKERRRYNKLAQVYHFVFFSSFFQIVLHSCMLLIQTSLRFVIAMKYKHEARA